MNPEPLLSGEGCGVGIGAGQMTVSWGSGCPALGVGGSPRHTWSVMAVSAENPDGGYCSSHFHCCSCFLLCAGPDVDGGDDRGMWAEARSLSVHWRVRGAHACSMLWLSSGKSVGERMCLGEGVWSNHDIWRM